VFRRQSIITEPWFRSTISVENDFVLFRKRGTGEIRFLATSLLQIEDSLPNCLSIMHNQATSIHILDHPPHHHQAPLPLKTPIQTPLPLKTPIQTPKPDRPAEMMLMPIESYSSATIHNKNTLTHTNGIRKPKQKKGGIRAVQ